MLTAILYRHGSGLFAAGEQSDLEDRFYAGPGQYVRGRENAKRMPIDIAYEAQCEEERAGRGFPSREIRVEPQDPGR